MKSFAVLHFAVLIGGPLTTFPALQGAFAQEQNPLESIGEFTSQEMEDCLASDLLPSFCFSEVVAACDVYVYGFTHNIYPCSTNTRTALRDWIVGQVTAQAPDSNATFEILQSIRTAYELCSDLELLAIEMGQQRVGTHSENCLNEITVLVADELWGAANSHP